MAEIKGRGTTVTIKYGKGFEETWVVFNGLTDEIRDDILLYFGVERESVTELTLSEIVLNVTQLAHAKGNVGKYLGGTFINQSSQSEARSSAEPSGDPWAEAGAAPAQPKENPLFGLVESCATVDELKRLWAENQEAFKEDEKLTAAWKAKGKALSGK